MSLKLIYNRVVTHVKFLSNDEDYLGSDYYTWHKKFIYEELIKNNYLDEEFFDQRSKYDEIEIWCDVIYALGAIDVQLRTEEQFKTPNPN
jgi:hypothetical protein